MKYIYGLRAAGSTEYRYIGQTKNPRRRLWGHNSEERDNAKCQWAQGIDKIEMDILATATLENGDTVEAAMIDKYCSLGHRLTNERKPRIKKATRDKLMRRLFSSRADDF